MTSLKPPLIDSQQLQMHRSDIEIHYEQQELVYEHAIEPLLAKLDDHRGALFASSFEYPGRYTCWDIGFYNPPLAITCREHHVEFEALNSRGQLLLKVCQEALAPSAWLRIQAQSDHRFDVHIQSSSEWFTEETRSQQPSVFTVIRMLVAFFKSPEDPYLGLYGAFAYDLIFQFESLEKLKARDAKQRDMLLYFPDEIYVVNHRKETAMVRRYDFAYAGASTQGLAREGQIHRYEPHAHPKSACDHEPGEYAALVNKAKESFARGDLFEVVPGQIFYAHYAQLPSQLFKDMRRTNPSPYGFLINLGESEYLVGASPEMYVRVQGRLVETCPISGTIQRGKNAIEDAQNIQLLLDSPKEASELTMCTDVDRNDKSRICEAGSVQVVGRRQIEMYSRLIHTVDHVQGVLRPEFDAVDAFLTHMWVVTVTGAPKLWAMNFIEQHEKSPRRWYSGAVGWFGFDGNLNTGLVLRTVRLQEGIAEVRVGATLLYDSNPAAEEQETRLKASAFLALLTGQEQQSPAPLVASSFGGGAGKRVLLVDHQDSFVHTLANYFRQTGAEVMTLRYDRALQALQTHAVDLVVLSPGPGRPDDFNLAATIDAVLARQIPLFGVCLGLQGIVEYFGGTLEVLAYPMHGKSSMMKVCEHHNAPRVDLFAGLGPEFLAGRYHSLYARERDLPAVLDVTAKSEDGIIMAISHQTLPVSAVQFHPETILSLTNQAGLKIISNLMQSI